MVSVLKHLGYAMFTLDFLFCLNAFRIYCKSETKEIQRPKSLD